MSIRVGLRHMGRVVGAVLCPDDEEIECSLFSAYNVCSTIPFEELTAQLSSAYSVCIDDKEYLTASLDSTYSTATAPT